MLNNNLKILTKFVLINKKYNKMNLIGYLIPYLI